MKFRLRVLARAETDALEAARWYEDDGPASVWCFSIKWRVLLDLSKSPRFASQGSTTIRWCVG